MLHLLNTTRARLSIAFAAIAVTRVAALSRSMWDWDEALFCLGVRDVTTLPALADRGRLSLTIESVSARAIVEIRVDGVIVDRFECTPHGMTKEWRIAANHAVALELSTSATARVPGDPRTLGLRLTRYDWSSL
jgi:hypothetical protein